jgi:hypothetical protein
MTRTSDDRADPFAGLGEGVREKLRRAHMQREDFEERLERFLADRPYRSVLREDKHAGRRSWVFEVLDTPPSVEWAALIGDCLFNFRSALDHFAYDLAVAYSGYPLGREVEEDSAFPIIWKRPPTAAAIERKTRAMHPEARRLIREMQPDRKGRHALRLLDELQNYDKHRTLHLLGAANKGVAFFGDRPFDEMNFGALNHGDVIAGGPIDGADRDVDPSFTFGVAFANDGPGEDTRCGLYSTGSDSTSRAACSRRSCPSSSNRSPD